jgi:hypothetical protein
VETWQYRDIAICYQPDLDGGGRVIADAFLRFVREGTAGRRFGYAFEWCAGPGFLGFALIADGLCEQLWFADVNPAALQCVAETVRANRLEERVRYCVSDNLGGIPRTQRFDLVVSNPPNFSRLNPRHPRYAQYSRDLRPNDPQWRLHRAFYQGIGGFLVPGAMLFISEVEPYRATVFDPVDDTEPFDLRERPCIQDLVPMIVQGGLQPVETTRYLTAPSGVDLYMMVSTKPDPPGPV